MGLAMAQHVDNSTRLLASAAGGDLEAFGRFYDQNVASVLGYFYRRTACPETAADLTAETFANALSSLRTFRSERGTGTAWLFGIARHQLSRFQRRRRIDTAARRRIGMRTDVALDDVSYERIEDLVDLQPVVDRLEGAVERLSPKLAAAVELRIGSELPFSEIARHLGCSEEAARARVSRALGQLADDMESGP